MNFIWYILIGILAGYFAGKIMRGGGFGLFNYDGTFVISRWSKGFL